VSIKIEAAIPSMSVNIGLWKITVKQAAANGAVVVLPLYASPNQGKTCVPTSGLRQKAVARAMRDAA